MTVFRNRFVPVDAPRKVMIPSASAGTLAAEFHFLAKEPEKFYNGVQKERRDEWKKQFSLPEI